MIGIAIKTFLGANWLSVGLVSAALFAAIGWDSSRKAAWMEKGKETVRVETRKANDAAVSTSDRVRARVRASGVHAQRDPNTID